MKKILLLLALLTGSVAAAHAIPRGAYVDNRGSVKYIVDQSGTEIYTIGRDGNVMITRVVVSEQQMDDGTIKVILRTSGMDV
ncbi:MAG: hypothetical protein K2L96_08220, partial [Muribaculaceae bacterium]|nr:hypothetical protein [Muribaculaceae bacterium]